MARPKSRELTERELEVMHAVWDLSDAAMSDEGLTVAELFDRIRVSMPPSNPSSVSAKEKGDIVAYLLKQNGFPAGKTELPSATDALKGIKFEATKPGVR